MNIAWRPDLAIASKELRMSSFMYSVWFFDVRAPAVDQDKEWVLMFIVQAESAEAALAWGDRIAHSYAEKHGDIFVRSYLEDPAEYSHCNGFDDIPRCVAGDETFDIDQEF